MGKMEREAAWSARDESFYEFLKFKYKDRQALQVEAEEKRKAAEKMTEGKDPHFHRMAIASEMAALRLEMAYMVERNNQLEQYVEGISWLTQRVDLLEGAYGHMKMMAETVRIDYASISKVLEKLQPLLKEQDDAKRIPVGTNSKVHSGKP